MAETLVLVGDPPVEVLLKASSRARRLSLRVSQLDGRVTLTHPPRVGQREARAFAEEKASWIRRHLGDRPEVTRPMPGSTLPFRGRPHDVIAAPGRSVRLGDGVIEVPERDPDKTPARLAAFLKHHARLSLADASGRHAAALGRQHGKITLRDTRSRWGSCSPEGNLMYSWRLIMAPPEVLDYVAAHEVAHLAHMNHSKAFWAEVAGLYPEFGAPRLWLRNEGTALHRFQFRG